VPWSSSTSSSSSSSSSCPSPSPAPLQHHSPSPSPSPAPLQQVVVDPAKVKGCLLSELFSPPPHLPKARNGMLCDEFYRVEEEEEERANKRTSPCFPPVSSLNSANIFTQTGRRTSPRWNKDSPTSSDEGSPERTGTVLSRVRSLFGACGDSAHDYGSSGSEYTPAASSSGSEGFG
jgi:hypothetical protein